MTYAYIYEIRNKENGHCYIGSTVNPKSRWMSHRTTLRGGRHHSFVLQKAWDKYGEDAFEFKILAQCSLADKIDYEKRCMVLQSYNILRTPLETPIRTNWVRSQEVRDSISAGVKKAMERPGAKARVSKQWLGVKKSAPSIEKMARSKWKPVACGALQITFLSRKFAAAHINVRHSTVSEAIRFGRKVFGKYDFRDVGAQN